MEHQEVVIDLNQPKFPNVLEMTGKQPGASNTDSIDKIEVLGFDGGDGAWSTERVTAMRSTTIMLRHHGKHRGLMEVNHETGEAALHDTSITTDFRDVNVRLKISRTTRA